MCTFPLEAGGRFLYANHQYWDVDVCTRRAWLCCQIPPSWKLGIYLNSHGFISRQGSSEQNRSSAIFVKACCRCQVVLAMKKQLCPAEKKSSQIVSIVKRLLKYFFSEFKTDCLTEMQGSSDVHPGQNMFHGLWWVLVLVFALTAK